MDNNLCVGTEVAFKDEAGKGEIIKILNSHQVIVLRQDGFEEVYRAKDLIIISPETFSEAAFKHIPEHIKEEDSKKKRLSKMHKKNNGLIWEVDLHIEHLVDSHRNLSNYEIVQIQIRHCQYTIEKAIKENVHKLVIIHGKGEGVLKEEVSQLLERYPVEAKDADYRIYGLGATEARIF